MRLPQAVLSRSWSPHVGVAAARSVHVILTGGGRIRNRGYFFPLTVLAEVLDDARVIPRPNSHSPPMRFQG
jgi:hypothetical protein